MQSLTIELVFNVSSQLFPDSTLSSFTNFLPEQLNLEGQWNAAISEKSHSSLYQNVTEEKFIIFHKKNFQSPLNFTIWNPFSTLPLGILLKL